MLQCFLKHGPGQQSAKKVECVIPGRAASTEASVKDPGKDEGENRDHHHRREDGPENSQHRSLITRYQFASSEREYQFKATGQLPERSPNGAPGCLSGNHWWTHCTRNCKSGGKPAFPS